MAHRTTHRIPITTPIPRIRDGYMVQSSFKGISEKSNDVNVDPETFITAENVILDEGGVLTNRPALVESDYTYTDGDIVKLWQFGDVKFILRKTGTSPTFAYELYAYQGMSTKNIVVESDTFLTNIEDKIFIWYGTSLKVYDIVKKDFASDDYIYVPITKIVTNTVESDYESPNKLTTSYRRHYLYHSASQILESDVIDKELKVYILSEQAAKVNASAEYYGEVELDSNIWKHQLITPQVTIGDGYSLLIENNGTGFTYVKYNSTELYISLDGKLFTQIYGITDFYGKIISISKDGQKVMVLSRGSLNILDIINFTWSEMDVPERTLQQWPSSTWDDIVALDKDEIFLILYAEGNGELELWHHTAELGWRRFIQLTGVPLWNYKSLNVVKNEGVISITFKYRDGDGKYQLYMRTGDEIKIVEIEDAWANFYGDMTIFYDANIPKYRTVYMTDYHKLRFLEYKYNSDWIKTCDKTFIVENCEYVTLNDNYLLIGWSEYDYDNSTPTLHLYIPHTLIYKWSNSYTSLPETETLPITPIYIDNDYIFGMNNGLLLSNLHNNQVQIVLEETVIGSNTLSVPNHVSTIKESYLAYNNELYMTQIRRDDNFNMLLYIPEGAKEIFTEKITALHRLGDAEIGIFTDNEIWYLRAMDSEIGTIYTKPVKSKLVVGCKDGGDVATNLDGNVVMFATRRGIAGLAPQEYMATTEQTIRFLSNEIQASYDNWYDEGAIKIVTYKYFVFYYQSSTKIVFVYDTRNSSWWKWKLPINIDALISDKKLQVLSDGKIYEFDNEKYVDLDNIPIEWTILSQRLHFGEINNYKHIKSINLQAQGDKDIFAVLGTKVYRDTYQSTKYIEREFEVDDIRTFLQRLNLLKVINFQYLLSSNRAQLKLNSVSIKYELKERIR